MSIRAAKIFLLLAGLPLLLTAVTADPASARKEPDEIQLGREAAAELEKQYGLVKDEALQERVERIGQELARIANELEVPATYGSSELRKYEYVFKVLDDKDVNALSMPGGFIYLNKGLVDYAQSDDELAGVIAHEIAHISHRHMMSLIREQARLNNQLAIALLAAIISGAPAADIGNVMMGARFIQIAKLNGYSREAEKDADMTALAYLSHSRYNPVGMLTFMERLARDEINRPAVEWGVYQTHPYPGDRSRAIAARLREMGVTIDRRAVTKAPKAEARAAEREGLFEVWLAGRKMFTPASDGQLGSEQRAREISDRLNALLDSGLRLRDIRLSLEPAAVLARGGVLIAVTEADSALAAPKSAAQVAREAYDVLYRVLFDQELERIY